MKMKFGVIDLEKKGVYRYSLVVKNNITNKEYIIPLNERDKKGTYKAFLTTIDSRTTDFYNEKQFVNYLKEKEYIDFTDGEAYITYKSVGETNALNIIYKDQELLGNIAKKYKHRTYIDENDSEFQRNFRQFMTDIQKGRFYRFMLERKYINEYLQRLLEEYIYGGNKSRGRDIIREFSRYKAFRAYILGKQQFEGKIKLKPIKLTKLSYKQTTFFNDNQVLEKKTGDQYLDYLIETKDYEKIAELYTLDQLEQKGVNVKVLDGLGQVETKESKIKKKG